jgi:hypothetical protein
MCKFLSALSAFRFPLSAFRFLTNQKTSNFQLPTSSFSKDGLNIFYRFLPGEILDFAITNSRF